MGSDREAGPLARRDILGVVLAGGESRRFGMDKALFPLLGRAMASWALEAMRPWTSSQVVITNSGEVAEALGVPGRPDRIPGLGPLGGLHAGLSWAREEGREGLFLLACDLPLVTGELVGRILGSWPEDSLAVVPGSRGPLGFEPLCAGYDAAGLQGLEALIETGKRSMESALTQMGTFRIRPTELGSREELAVAFTNVNTLDTARWAENVLRARVSASEAGRPDRGCEQ
ncbi:MAG: molybdenum cofactor guanylyltransferase [Gemmatimonadota bacterium]